MLGNYIGLRSNLPCEVRRQCVRAYSVFALENDHEDQSYCRQICSFAPERKSKFQGMGTGLGLLFETRSCELQKFKLFMSNGCSSVMGIVSHESLEKEDYYVGIWISSIVI